MAMNFKPLRLGRIRTMAAQYGGTVTVQPSPRHGPGGRMIKVMMPCQDGRPLYITFWVDMAAADYTLSSFSSWCEAEILQHMYRIVTADPGAFV